MNARAVGLLALSLGSVACAADYSGLEIVADGRLREGTAVETRPLVLPAGRVARIHARPRSSTSDMYEEHDELVLRSDNLEVLRVFEDDEDWRWALVGRSLGETCLEVLIRGSFEECIEIQVTAGP